MRAVRKITPIVHIEWNLPSGVVFTLLFFVIGVFLIPINLFAEETSTGSFLVYPSKHEVSLIPGGSTKAFVTIANRTLHEATFEISVEDIEPREGAETVTLLGRKVGLFSVQNVLTPEIRNVVIPAGREVVVPISVSIPEETSPGGKYGAIIVSLSGSSNVPSASAARTMSRIASLFFIRIEGESRFSGGLLWLKAKRWHFTNEPLTVSVGFENTGNVHVNPYGLIGIKSLLTSKEELIQIDPYYALPGGVRERMFTVPSYGRFGPYRVSLELNRGYNDIVDTDSFIVWILPWRIVAGIFLLVAIGILLVWRRRVRLASV